MWTRTLWPLQLGVERVQDIELHGLEEAVTLVFKYNRHHDLTAVLQVPLDVIHLRGKGGVGGRKEFIIEIICSWNYCSKSGCLVLPPSLYIYN